MFKAKIKAAEAREPFNKYDSLLEIPKSDNLNQHALLTVQLRVALNFVDSKQAPQGLGFSENRVLGADRKWYAKDSGGWLFPLLDWDKDYKEMFREGLKQKAEKVWNRRFLLLTPTDYPE